jgi:hypothetical protein
MSAAILESESLRFSDTTKLMNIDDTNRRFYIPSYADIFVGPVLPKGEKYWYCINGLEIPANGPLLCYALGFAYNVLVTEYPHPEGVKGRYCMAVETDKTRNLIVEPINNLIYQNGTIIRLFVDSDRK